MTACRNWRSAWLLVASTSSCLKKCHRDFLSLISLAQKQWWGLAEFAMKYNRTKQFKAFIEELLPWINEIEVQKGTDYARLLIRYVADSFTGGDAETFVAASERYLSDELGGDVMTIAQQFKDMGRQEGLQQGMQQGELKGKLETNERVAIRLLVRGMSIDGIAEVTGLSVDAINALKTKTQH